MNEAVGKMLFSQIFNVHQCTRSTGASYNPKNSRVTCAWHDMTFVLQRYLAELVLAQQPLPRRQEAESLEFTSGGIAQSALVTHEEVQEWATGSRKAIMCSISHAWETREHPDPCRQGTGSFWNSFLFPTTRLKTSLPLFPTVVSMNEWLLFPWLLWLPGFVFSMLRLEALFKEYVEMEGDVELHSVCIICGAMFRSWRLCAK